MRLPGRGFIERETVALCFGAVLLYLSFPGRSDGAWYLAFFAFVPLFYYVERKKSSWHRSIGGLLFGFISYFPTLSWVEFTLSTYGKLGPVIGYAGAVSLALYVGIFLSIFACITGKALDWGRGAAFVTIPFAWSFIELVRFRWDLGFPWMVLGYSQMGNVYVRNAASYVGVIGLGFIVMMVNILVFSSLDMVLARRRKGAVLSIMAAFLLVFVLFALGSARLNAGGSESGAARVSVRIVQPAIDQWKKWDVEFRDQTINILSSLSFVGKGKTELIIWPETALPFFPYVDEDATEVFLEHLRRSTVPVLTGVPWYDPLGDRFYNSIVLFQPDGSISARYNKIKLVPFGEYVPFRPLLFFVDRLTGGGEDFSRGKEVVIIRSGDCNIVPSVCYEAIFPRLSAEGVSKGGNILVNLTNDAWFGDTTAPYQHLAMARMRAVETGRYMVRCANSGISALIDWRGEVVDEIRLFRKGVLNEEVPLLTGMTFYVKNVNLIDSCILVGFPLLFTTAFLAGRWKNGRSL